MDVHAHSLIHIGFHVLHMDVNPREVLLTKSQSIEIITQI